MNKVQIPLPDEGSAGDRVLCCSARGCSLPSSALWRNLNSEEDKEGVGLERHSALSRTWGAGGLMPIPSTPPSRTGQSRAEQERESCRSHTTCPDDVQRGSVTGTSLS